MPRSQRLLVAGGIPAVAAFAVIQRQRNPGASPDAGEGDQFAAGSGVTTIDPSAIGVSAGQIGQLTESFADSIGGVEKRLELIEGQRADDEARDPGVSAQMLAIYQATGWQTDGVRRTRGEALADATRFGIDQATFDAVLASNPQVTAALFGGG